MSIRWDRSARRSPTTGPPDLVLRGGRILTGRRGDRPGFASSIALRGDRIVAVGDDDVAGTAAPTTEVVDLGGRTVVPGLIDSHVHLVRGGATWSDELRWFELPTLEAALGTIRAEVERTPAGTWIRAVGGWHGGQFREGRGPTREELTALAPEHPVYVQLLYEEAVLNDAALAAAGIDAATPDPPLGTFVRGTGGTPTGTVRGIGAFTHILGQVPPLDRDGQVASTAAMMRDLNRYGLTGVVDAGGLGMPPEAYEPLFQLWREGGVTLKVRLYVCPVTRGDEERELVDWMRFTRPGFGDGWLRHVGVGEIVNYGCHDLEGLTDFRVADGTEEVLERTLLEVARRGWPLHLHSVLDTTTSTILDVFERVDRRIAIDQLRWSLAHVEPVSTRNLDRIAALGVGIAVQDRLVYRATDSAHVWGEDAVRRGPPLRDVLDRAIPLGAGTDSTRVSSPNPWVSLWWLVTGRTYDAGPERDPSQCLTRLEAIEAYTRGSAWFSLEEQERGTLTVGAAADLAVLDDDYFTVADDDIRRLGADLTVADGRVVHARGDFDGLAGPGPA